MESADLKKLQQVIGRIGIPQQPSIILELANEQLKEDPDFARIESIVIRDIGVAGYVLKVINSPYFSIRVRVKSIQQALVMLGLKQINNLVTEKLLGEVLKTKNTSLTREIWKHSRNTALICSMLAEEIRMPFKPDKDSAYTLGLFHDCGILLLMRKVPDYMDIFSEATNSETPLHEIEQKELGIDHHLVGYAMAQAWRLDADIADTIREHNVFPKWESGKTASHKRELLAAILELSEVVLREESVDPGHLAFLGFREADFQQIEERLLIRMSIEERGVDV